MRLRRTAETKRHSDVPGDLQRLTSGRTCPYQTLHRKTNSAKMPRAFFLRSTERQSRRPSALRSAFRTPSVENSCLNNAFLDAVMSVRMHRLRTSSPVVRNCDAPLHPVSLTDPSTETGSDRPCVPRCSAQQGGGVSRVLGARFSRTEHRAPSKRQNLYI